jgi:hypothetical protein
MLRGDLRASAAKPAYSKQENDAVAELGEGGSDTLNPSFIKTSRTCNAHVTSPCYRSTGCMLPHVIPG